MPVRTTTYTDAFTRADNVDLGADWDSGYTGWDPLQIVTNRVRATNVATTANETVNAVSLTAPQFAQLTVATFQGSVQNFIGIRLRWANAPTLTGYSFTIRRSLDASFISRWTAGVEVNLIEENATTWAAGDILRGEAENGNLRLYRNGVLLLSTTDANHTSGKAGVVIFGSATGALGDIEIDDFSAGNLVGPAFVNTISATIATAASTWSIATHSSRAGGAAFIVGVGVASSAVTVSAMTDNTTNVYALAVRATTPRPVAGAELWYTPSLSSASTRISVTLSGSATGSIAVGQWTGVSTGTPVDVTGALASTAANSSLYGSSQITPTSTSGLVVSFTRLTASTLGTITNLSTMTTWVSTQTTGVVRTHGLYHLTVDSGSTKTGSFKSSSKALHASVIAAFHDTFVAPIGGGAFYGFALMGVQ